MSTENLEGWYANGQLWFLFTPTVNAQQRLTDIQDWQLFRSDQSFTTTDDAIKISQAFDEDTRPLRLRNALNNRKKFKIPDGNNGFREVLSSERLMVITVHKGEEGLFHYGITDGVDPNTTSVAVNGSYSSIESPRPYLQDSPAIITVNNKTYIKEHYYLWIDGSNDLNAGRIDFPVLGSATRNGTPHLFMLYYSEGHNFSELSPVVTALHGSDGTPKVWSPENTKMEGINILPNNVFTIAHDDSEHVIKVDNGNLSIVVNNTGWFGYRKDYDHFERRNIVDEANEIIINYTQLRILFIKKWAEEQKMADPNRTALVGYSMGSTGGVHFLKTHPNIWSTVTLFNQGFRRPSKDDGNFKGLRGNFTQNLLTNITDSNKRQLRLAELYTLLKPSEPNGEYPLTRFVNGVRDDEETMWWKDKAGIPGQPNIYSAYDIPIPDSLVQMDSEPYGFQMYWDNRDHGLNSFKQNYWGLPDRQTARDNFDYTANYKKDQSYPAFFNHYSFRSASPHSDEVGTLGGYHNWDINSIVDKPNYWECTFWLISKTNGKYLADDSPFNNLRSSFMIKKAQLFKPKKNLIVFWEAYDIGSNTETQSGKIIANAEGQFIIEELVTIKDGLRQRLKLWTNNTVIN